MWMLSFIPDSFLHLVIILILCAGAGVYVLSIFFNFAVPLIPYKEPARILGTLLIIAGVFFYGSYDTEIQWRKQVEEMQAKIKVAEEKSKQTNIKIVTKIHTRLKVIKEYKTVYKNQIKEIATKIDNECKVDPDAIKILNNAAKEPPEKLK
jgi:hypothetical protein